MEVKLGQQLLVLQVLVLGDLHHVAAHLYQPSTVGCVDVQHLVVVHLNVQVVFGLGRTFWDEAGGHKEAVLVETH